MLENKLKGLFAFQTIGKAAIVIFFLPLLTVYAYQFLTKHMQIINFLLIRQKYLKTSLTSFPLPLPPKIISVSYTARKKLHTRIILQKKKKNSL